MHYSRREMLDLVLDFVGETNDSKARALAAKLLNIAVQNIWMKMAWQQFEVTAPYTFTTITGTPSYPLPAYFGRIRDGIIRNLTTGARLRPGTRKELEQRHPTANIPGVDEPGLPGVYTVAGAVGVDTQLAAAGEVCTAVSTDALDTTVRLTIAGLDINGRFRRAQYQLNGALPVTVGTWTKVIEVSKAWPAGTDGTTPLTSSRGTVSVTAATTGELVQLLDYQTAIERHELTLWPTPNAAYVIAVPILRAPTKLLYDADLCPWGWGPALLEEMDELWKVNTGLLPRKSNVPGPALLDLVAQENSGRFGVPMRVQPFSG